MWGEKQRVKPFLSVHVGYDAYVVVMWGSVNGERDNSVTEKTRIIGMSRFSIRWPIKLWG